MEKNDRKEKDIRRDIDKVLSSWNGKYEIEKDVDFTLGKVNTKGNKEVREKPKRADYVLYYTKSFQIAVIEAKDNKHLPSSGIEQAMEYAKYLNLSSTVDIPFCYSTNGDSFDEYDTITGRERSIPFNSFPTPEALFERYKTESGVSDEEVNLLLNTSNDLSNKIPREYQRTAIDRVLKAIARGEKRLFLTMATGSGKTNVAYQIVRRLIEMYGEQFKILYLTDRDELLNQPMGNDFLSLQKLSCRIDFSKGKDSAHTLYFGLYQQLSGDVEEGEDTLTKFQELFTPDFFNFVIVDECHRGSRKANSKWRKILDYFNGAIQLGMTATPKDGDEGDSNTEYFGKPIYRYSMKDGIEDGFLAPFKVVEFNLNVDQGWTPEEGTKDIRGEEIETREYTGKDYGKKIILEDRNEKVAYELTNYLKEKGDRLGKMIVFSPTIEAAETMRRALNNANTDITKKHPDYVVRLTSGSFEGKKKLDYFSSPTTTYPVIATTSKLLSTGFDCPTLKYIVIDQNIKSISEFKQIIGRGSRIYEKDGKGKRSFTILDFKGICRKMFTDPDWDGEVEFVNDGNGGGSEGGGTHSVNNIPIVGEGTVDVKTLSKTESIVDSEGKMKTTNYVALVKQHAKEVYKSLENFITYWNDEEKKDAIYTEFLDVGLDIEDLKKSMGMSDYDDFDFILELAFNKKAPTRRERAEKLKNGNFIQNKVKKCKNSEKAKEILEVLIDKYADNGITEIKNQNILQVEPLKELGKPAKIIKFFGSKDIYDEVIKDLIDEIYRVG